MAATSNTTALTRPFPKDLVMAFPRMMARAGSFAFITVPERIDSMLGFRNGGSMIAEATGNGTWNMVSEALSSGSVSGIAVPTPSGTAETTESLSRGFNSMSIAHVRNFGGIFTYMTSKWALACFTLVSLRFVLITSPVSTEPRLTVDRQSFLIEPKSTLPHDVTSICLGLYDFFYE